MVDLSPACHYRQRFVWRRQAARQEDCLLACLLELNDDDHPEDLELQPSVATKIR